MRQVGRSNHSWWECKFYVFLIPRYPKKAIIGQKCRELGDLLKRPAQQKVSHMDEGHFMPNHVTQDYIDSAELAVGFSKIRIVAARINTDPAVEEH